VTAQQIMDCVIEDGIQSVLDSETRVSHRRGGVAGFEICRKLASISEYERILTERHKQEHQMRMTKPKSLDLEDYWEHRCATVQVEWCYEIIKVILGYSPVSARAAMKVYSVLNRFNYDMGRQTSY
jgi:hypothetical protein